MQIRIKIHGHQFFNEIEGEVLLWTHGVEHFRGESRQVPCVIVRCNGHVSIVTLQRELFWVEVEEIPTPDSEALAGRDG